MVHQALGHDLGGAELLPPDEDVDMRGVLGQICRDV